MRAHLVKTDKEMLDEVAEIMSFQLLEENL